MLVVSTIQTSISVHNFFFVLWKYCCAKVQKTNVDIADQSILSLHASVTSGQNNGHYSANSAHWCWLKIYVWMMKDGRWVQHVTLRNSHRWLKLGCIHPNLWLRLKSFINSFRLFRLGGNMYSQFVFWHLQFNNGFPPYSPAFTLTNDHWNGNETKIICKMDTLFDASTILYVNRL